MDKIKGYDKLSEIQKKIFIYTFNRHHSSLGSAAKEEYTPISVKELSQTVLKVTFKNGQWLHYNANLDWY